RLETRIQGVAVAAGRVGRGEVDPAAVAVAEAGDVPALRLPARMRGLDLAGDVAAGRQAAPTDPDVEQVFAGLAALVLEAVGADLQRFALDRQPRQHLFDLGQELGGGLLRRLVLHAIGVLGAGAAGKQQARQRARDGETPWAAVGSGL